MKSIVTRRVLREGIRYRNSVYYHVGLRPYEGAQVIVHKEKYGLWVFDTHGNLICKAEKITFSSAIPAEGKNLVSD
jgi:hypothetical protein